MGTDWCRAHVKPDADLAASAPDVSGPGPSAQFGADLGHAQGVDTGNVDPLGNAAMFGDAIVLPLPPSTNLLYATGPGSAIPVVSMITRSNFNAPLSRFSFNVPRMRIVTHGTPRHGSVKW